MLGSRELQSLISSLKHMEDPIIPNSVLCNLSFLDWKSLAKSISNESFYQRYNGFIDWDDLLNYSRDLNFIEKHIHKAQNLLKDKGRFTEEFYEKYSDKIDWSKISYNDNISDKFLIKHFDRGSYRISNLRYFNHLWFRKHQSLANMFNIDNTPTKFVQTFNLYVSQWPTKRQLYLERLSYSFRQLKMDF